MKATERGGVGEEWRGTSTDGAKERTTIAHALSSVSISWRASF